MICIQTTRRGGTSRDWYRAKPVWALSIIIASPLSLFPPNPSLFLSLPPSPLWSQFFCLFGGRYYLSTLFRASCLFLLPISRYPCDLIIDQPRLSIPAAYDLITRPSWTTAQTKPIFRLLQFSVIFHSRQLFLQDGSILFDLSHLVSVSFWGTPSCLNPPRILRSRAVASSWCFWERLLLERYRLLSASAVSHG